VVAGGSGGEDLFVVDGAAAVLVKVFEECAKLLVVE
jgi:hypothetical protein